MGNKLHHFGKSCIFASPIKAHYGRCCADVYAVWYALYLYLLFNAIRPFLWRKWVDHVDLPKPCRNLDCST